MRIIGIDPGYERLGIAVIENVTGTETLLYSECFQTDAKLPISERLLLIGNHLQEIIKEYSPEHLASEHIFFNTNQKTAIDVAAVRGILLYIAKANNVEVFEYTPPQIKVAVGGNGRADKKAITGMVHHLIKITKDIKLDDEYDAIAVALTHSAIHRK